MELAKVMTFQEVPEDSFVYKMEEKADNFYVLLKGKVVEEVKNPQIE